MELWHVYSNSKLIHAHAHIHQFKSLPPDIGTWCTQICDIVSGSAWLYFVQSEVKIWRNVQFALKPNSKQASISCNISLFTSTWVNKFSNYFEIWELLSNNYFKNYQNDPTERKKMLKKLINYCIVRWPSYEAQPYSWFGFRAILEYLKSLDWIEQTK